MKAAVVSGLNVAILALYRQVKKGGELVQEFIVQLTTPGYHLGATQIV